MNSVGSGVVFWCRVMNSVSSDTFAALAPFELLILDLDGTLYDETIYLHAAYATIARDAAAMTGQAAGTIEAFLRESFASEGRSGLFDRMATKFGLSADHLTRALASLRGVVVPGGLMLYPAMADLIDWAKIRGKKLAVLTNGNVVQQKNKVAQLALPGGIKVYFANQSAPKPSPLAVQRILADFSCPPGAAILIGDDPVDEGAARAAGIAFRHARDFLT